jgi:hypothetical protein
VKLYFYFLIKNFLYKGVASDKNLFFRKDLTKGKLIELEFCKNTQNLCFFQVEADFENVFKFNPSIGISILGIELWIQILNKKNK